MWAVIFLAALTTNDESCVSLVSSTTTKTITVRCSTSSQLATVLNGATLDGMSMSKLIIEKDPTVAEEVVWNDFRFDKNAHGSGSNTELVIRNLKLYTASLDAYALHTANTRVYLHNVRIEGYSGKQLTTGTGMQTGGGAMRIEDADYCDDSPRVGPQNPVARNVHVLGGCRGFRFQNSHCVYVKDSSATDVSDNAFYFAADPKTSAHGCTKSTFDNCTATNVGNVGFMLIGGDNNIVKHSSVYISRGAGIQFHQTTGNFLVSHTEFREANTFHTTTPWSDGTNGNTDDAGGATIGVSVADTDAAHVQFQHCSFHGGGESDSTVVGPVCPATIAFPPAFPSQYNPSAYAATPWPLPDASTNCIERPVSIDPFDVESSPNPAANMLLLKSPKSNSPALPLILSALVVLAAAVLAFMAFRRK